MLGLIVMRNVWHDPKLRHDWQKQTGRKIFFCNVGESLHTLDCIRAFLVSKPLPCILKAMWDTLKPPQSPYLDLESNIAKYRSVTDLANLLVDKGINVNA
jgi:hypothetical protein